MKTNLYKFFDIEKNATKEEIKKAYYKKAKQTHPDKNSNKRDDFELANKYYMILIDDKKRKQYDETGNINEEVKQNMHLQFLSQLFKNIIDSSNKFYKDVFSIMLGKIDSNIVKYENEIINIKKQIKKYKKIKKQITPKNKENMFIYLIEQEIRFFNKNIDLINNNIKIQKEAYQYLKQGKFKFKATTEVMYKNSANITFTL